MKTIIVLLLVITVFLGAGVGLYFHSQNIATQKEEDSILQKQSDEHFAQQEQQREAKVQADSDKLKSDLNAQDRQLDQMKERAAVEQQRIADQGASGATNSPTTADSK